MHAQNKTPDSTLQPEITNKPKTDKLTDQLEVNHIQFSNFYND